MKKYTLDAVLEMMHQFIMLLASSKIVSSIKFNVNVNSNLKIYAYLPHFNIFCLMITYHKVLIPYHFDLRQTSKTHYRLEHVLQNVCIYALWLVRLIWNVPYPTLMVKEKVAQPKLLKVRSFCFSSFLIAVY